MFIGSLNLMRFSSQFISKKVPIKVLIAKKDRNMHTIQLCGITVQCIVWFHWRQINIKISRELGCLLFTITCVFWFLTHSCYLFSLLKGPWSKTPSSPMADGLAQTQNLLISVLLTEFVQQEICPLVTINTKAHC